MSQTDIQSEDSRLHCLTCDYNLTGVTSNRCPECGSEFDREYLISVRDGTGEPGPIPIWDDRAQIGLVRAYVKTMSRVWFRPDRFVATFPLVHDQRSSQRFVIANGVFLAALVVACCLICGTSARRSSDALVFIVALGIATQLVAMVFAELFSAYLADADRYDEDVRRTHNRWRGILRFWTSFNFVAIALAFSMAMMGELRYLPKFTTLAMPVTLLICWLHLFTVIILVGRRLPACLADMFIIAPLFAIVACTLFGPIAYCMALFVAMIAHQSLSAIIQTFIY